MCVRYISKCYLRKIVMLHKNRNNALKCLYFYLLSNESHFGITLNRTKPSRRNKQKYIITSLDVKRIKGY